MSKRVLPVFVYGIITSFQNEEKNGTNISLTFVETSQENIKKNFVQKGLPAKMFMQFILHLTYIHAEEGMVVKIETKKINAYSIHRLHQQNQKLLRNDIDEWHDTGKLPTPLIYTVPITSLCTGYCQNPRFLINFDD
ncbi:hypothetical protein WUBG_07500 [Wuchereria bancrofti]|uniref:Uncharacterized protein n=1 Tax=Wuchereria bancrofti TaxID=6293 RepID=J9EHI6_WUCBA|nr:hypothetical protein WUBG_07500 [Wuchereria bancrofti]